MMNDDKLRIYIAPNRIARLPRGYRNLEHRGDKWIWVTLLSMALTGFAIVYGLYRVFR